MTLRKNWFPLVVLAGWALFTSMSMVEFARFNASTGAAVTQTQSR